MGSTCIGGMPPRNTTYSEAVALCALASDPSDPDVGDLELCDISCRGKGCGYNTWPVFSSLPCRLPPPTPPTPPVPPPPSAPVYPIPPLGVQVLDGGKNSPSQLGCLRPDADEGTTHSAIDRRGATLVRPIAAQCCRVGETDPALKCKRYIGAEQDDSTCIGGMPPRNTTYSEAVALCALKSDPSDPEVGALELCDISCREKGCGYNQYPVFSSLPCPVDDYP